MSCYRDLSAQFDHDVHSPHVLSACGHTICRDCVIQLRRTVQRGRKKKRVVECPICRRETTSNIRKNFELLELIVDD